jgi:ketosteroid isomerase-like protein
MKRGYGLGVAIVFIIASGAVALGQSPKKPAPAGEDTAATVAIMDHIWLDAAHNRDTETMDWLFVGDFVEIHPGGDIVNKHEQIDQIKDPSRANLELHPDNIQVLYASPDVAVLTDITTIKGLSGGVNYDGKHRVIRVFVKQRGRWRAAGAGIARITAQ